MNGVKNTMAGPGLSQLPPLSLYVHLPWCIKKCPYCDFNSHEWREPSTAGRKTVPIMGPQEPVSQWLADDLQQRYIECLIADLESALPLVWGRSVQTVFIGGGTPSLFEPRYIDQLLTALRARLRLSPTAEITMEANPGSFEVERFSGFAAAGVNRLSLGVQSFNADHLKALGRVHDRSQALRAAEHAARHYPSFNLDLMYALPGQGLAQLEEDLKTALSFEPPHLSYYQLTLEPNTLFAAKPPELPDDDCAADMQEAIEAATQVRGLEHYEISAYARPAHRSQHNLNYWQFGDYLGIGAGAHGKLSFHDRIIRQARLRHPKAYIDAVATGKPAVEVESLLDPASLPFEFMLNALRLIDGVSASLFIERTGLWPTAIGTIVQRACDQGLMTQDPTRYQATALGLRFLNDLQQRFLETEHGRVRQPSSPGP